MRTTRSLLENLSTDELVRRELVPICVIRDTLVSLNGRGAALLGRPEGRFPKALPLRKFVAEADWPRVARSLRGMMLRPGNGVSITFSAVRRDGSIIDLELTGTVVAGEGEVGIVAVVNDVTDRVRDDARLNYLAFSDGLTGLPNRMLFLDRLRQSLGASRRSGVGFALLALDLDGFKSINDSYGHEAGDQVLRVAAEMLRSCCREVDTAARIGGDEFALILPGISDPDEAARVANRLIVAVGEPIAIDGDSCSVGASVGIALYPRHGRDIETLVRVADAAMYASKASGGNCSSLADPGRGDGKAPCVNIVTWKDAHKLDIGTIDEQHRALAGLVRRVGAELAAGRDASRLRESLEELVAFARGHFAAEEALMDQYAIADRATHKQSHRRLLQDAMSLANTPCRASMTLTAGFLHEWLIRHVDSADRELARALLAKGYCEGNSSNGAAH
jgi:diguanylate cyclase (GGDEF)-like protein/hemerythrin-like metal-binding protein